MKSILNPNRSLRILFAALVGVLSVFAANPNAHSALQIPIYGIASLDMGHAIGWRYQFGVFDLGSPTGVYGNYSYAWNSLGSYPSAPLANLVKDPTTSQMYLQYSFNQFRTVGTDGTIGASSLGTMNSAYGMAFDLSGNLYSVYTPWNQPSVWYTLNPATGSTVSSTSLTGGINISGQVGGGMAYSGDGSYYFSDYPYSSQPNGRLVRIGSDGSASVVGNFAGTGYDQTKRHALFSSGLDTYLLNNNNLYIVDLSDASLDRLGSITGLPAEFSAGFSGVVGVPASAAVPEPGQVAASLVLLAGIGGYVWLKRRKVAKAAGAA